MNIEQFIVFLLIGGVAGWLAGVILKGGGFGILGNIIVGCIGALVGGWLFGVLGISVGGEWLGALLMVTVGAVVLLFLIGLIKKLEVDLSIWKIPWKDKKAVSIPDIQYGLL